MSEDLPLGPPIRKERPQVDPDKFEPIPGRPGWFKNARGQMMRQGQIPPSTPWFVMPKP